MRSKSKKNNALSSLVVVKHQLSQDRGPLYRVCVFINGERLIRPGFHNKKSAIKLAAMMVQQMLVNGCRVSWKVYDDKGNLVDINLAALGNKMQRGEKMVVLGKPSSASLAMVDSKEANKGK